MKKIESVLKFTSLDFALDMIKNSYIHLSSPLKFNDPLDSYFITLILKRPSIETKTVLEEYMKIAEKKFIFCGTSPSNLENVLMWSHYGNFHRGIALKYKVPENYEGKLGLVSYDPHDHNDFMEAIGNGNPFKIPKKDPEEKEKLVLESAFIKDSEWKYEEEIRYLRNFEKHESTVEYGWEVESVYIGSEYLDNDNEKLEKIIGILDFCRENKIKVFPMEYSYDEKNKRFQLKKKEWMQHEHMLEVENYSRIRRRIIYEIKTRLENSAIGEALNEIIKDVSEKVVEKKLSEISSYIERMT